MARLDFANARIRARRPSLAGPAQLRNLLARPSLDARLEALRALPLGAALSPAPGPDPLGAVERSLRDALRREALALVRDAEGRNARELLVAYLAADEGDAVKAVVRGVARGAAIDAILAAAPPVPGLSDDALRQAAASTSVDAALGALAAAGSAVAAAVRGAVPSAVPRAAPRVARTRLARTGRKARDEVAPAPERDRLLEVEIAADRAALGRARAACRGRGEDGAVLAAHLADRADARNAATLLLVAGAPPAAERWVPPWVPGGRRWGKAALEALARTGPEAARAAVAQGFPGVGAALARPWAADRALERAVLASLRREARQRPLSIAVPLAWLAARREEVRRVALVLRGAALELPADEILDLVEA